MSEQRNDTSATHGAELEPPERDSLPPWYFDDSDMWAGLTMSMTTFLQLERLREAIDGCERGV